MSKRINDRELFELRNFIPIHRLIKEKLKIPSKEREGFFRFLCPICNEFNTAVNPKTNLGRCFRCSVNFNPIDMVMIVKKIRFIKSIAYLKSLMPELSDGSISKSQKFSKTFKNITRDK